MNRTDLFMGSAWNRGDGPPAHATVWMDSAGRFTSESYNLSDRKGDKPFRGLRRNHPLREMLLRLREEARSDARHRKAYADERRRDTRDRDLQFAFLVTVGRHGHTVYVDRAPDSSKSIQGYGLDDGQLAELHRLEIPYIDKRPVPEKLLTAAVLHGPLPPRKLSDTDPPPWTALSVAPLPVYAAFWQSFGADVCHVTPDVDQLKNVTGMQAREAKLLSAYSRGDSIALFQAMNVLDGPTDDA